MKIFGCAALILGFGLSAFGDSVTFTFDKSGSVAALTPTTSTNTDIGNYMTAVLQAAGCIGCTVTVTNPGGAHRVYVDDAYTGESHVVGPGGSPVTLATYENAQDNTGLGGTKNTTNDNFISNISDGSSSGGNAILLTFSLPTGYSLGNGVSFDFEIFPDAGCQAKGSCPTPATFEFKAGENSLADVNDFGTNGVLTAAFPGAGDPNGSSTKNGSTTQTAAQWIGTYSSSSPFASYNQLEFIDWPAAIGVDNLKLTFSKVPETSSVALLGTLALFMIPLVRRFRKA